jgi:hypothetical protein
VAPIWTAELERQVYLATKAFVSSDLHKTHKRSAGVTRRSSFILLLSYRRLMSTSRTKPR